LNKKNLATLMGQSSSDLMGQAKRESSSPFQSSLGICFFFFFLFGGIQKHSSSSGMDHKSTTPGFLTRSGFYESVGMKINLAKSKCIKTGLHVFGALAF
jgi:hypothetical protein